MGAHSLAVQLPCNGSQEMMCRIKVHSAAMWHSLIQSAIHSHTRAQAFISNAFAMHLNSFILNVILISLSSKRNTKRNYENEEMRNKNKKWRESVGGGSKEMYK